MGRPAAALLGLVLLYGALPSAPAEAQQMQSDFPRKIDLRSYEDVTRLEGMNRLDLFGERLTVLEDFNGDGEKDVALAACSHGERAGRVYVLLGPVAPQSGPIDDAASFIVSGSEPDMFACSVASGDINGDGLSDLLVGAFTADNNDRAQSGSVYVVFGTATPSDVNLATFDSNTQGTSGYRIDGPGTLSLAGQDVDVAGDINGDGKDDIIVGSVFSATYIVFGQDHPLPVDLLSFHLGVHGDRGYLIDHRAPETSDLYSAGGVGDVNGDGIPDIGIGVTPRRGRRVVSTLYVAFGKATPDPQSVRDDNLGFRLVGRRGGVTGASVDGVADMNGDGLGEIVVGEPGTYGIRPGSAYVVFGKASHRNVDLTELGRRGFRIHGVQTELGMKVAHVGDLNHDRLPDVGIGDPFGTYNGRTSGALYIVFGKSGARPVRVDRWSDAFMRIDGGYGAPCNACAGEGVGRSMASLGDLEGDGRHVLMLGASGAYRDDRGRAYLVRLPRLHEPIGSP